jgi:hypothetical protein
LGSSELKVAALKNQQGALPKLGAADSVLKQ